MVDKFTEVNVDDFDGFKKGIGFEKEQWIIKIKQRIKELEDRIGMAKMHFNDSTKLEIRLEELKSLLESEKDLGKIPASCNTDVNDSGNRDSSTIVQSENSKGEKEE